MNETKQKILDVSLELFSRSGFSAVSIRDICKEVGIKESSVYYHFKNKQAILDELLARFQEVAAGMMEQLQNSLTGNHQPLAGDFYTAVCDRFFEDYLMDSYCNRVMRLMSIERFCNDEIRAVYGRWMLDEPLKFQSGVFSLLGQTGVIRNLDSEYLAVSYYSPIFLFAQKWLLTGELTQEKKAAFRREAYRHIQLFFAEIGGA